MEKMQKRELNGKDQQIFSDYFVNYDKSNSAIRQFLGKYLSGKKRNDAIIPIELFGAFDKIFLNKVVA